MMKIRVHRGVRFLRLSGVIGVLLFVGGAIGAPPSLTCQQTPVAKLTLSQIEDLVTHSVPDTTLSAQIQRRGIAFAATPAILDSLRAKGAGPATVAAIVREQPSELPGNELVPKPVVSPKSVKLTDAQIHHLIKIRAADAFVSAQIESRGLDFSLKPKDIVSFNAEGAGPRTLEALRGFVRTGGIMLHTEPQADVSLDGVAAGHADALGILQLQDVSPGPHTLVLSKEGFQQNRQTVTLADRENRQLSLPLQWTGGFLTVTALPASVAISVAGPKSFTGSGNRIQCTPGSYTAIFSLEGYVTQTRTFQLAAGEDHDENVTLAVDKAYLSELLAAAKTKLAGGDSSGAVESAHKILNLSPGNPAAQAILAEASFQSGDYRGFMAPAIAAIHSGEPVTVRMMHVHNFPRRMVHSVDITFSSTGIKLASTDPNLNCKLPENLDYNVIAQPGVMRDEGGALVLHFLWFKQPPGHKFMAAAHGLDFVPEGSAVVPPPGTVVVLGGGNIPIQSPANTAESLQAIAGLLQTEQR